jgi:hypothetical protein
VGDEALLTDIIHAIIRLIELSEYICDVQELSDAFMDADCEKGKKIGLN